jgi:hypothetical protein
VLLSNCGHVLFFLVLPLVLAEGSHTIAYVHRGDCTHSQLLVVHNRRGSSTLLYLACLVQPQMSRSVFHTYFLFRLSLFPSFLSVKKLNPNSVNGTAGALHSGFEVLRIRWFIVCVLAVQAPVGNFLTVEIGFLYRAAPSFEVHF